MSIPIIYQEEAAYVPRTEQIWIKSNDILSKNLYNEANYIVRQEFIKSYKESGTGNYLNCNILDYLIKDKSKNYSLMTKV